MTSDHVKICAALDPRISKKNEDQNEQIDSIRNFLVEMYNVSFENGSQDLKEKRAHFSIFDSDGDSDGDENNDEIEKFFAATQRADKSCTNVVDWWKREGQHKYPKIAMLARDTLMAMGSSVPSESTFSDSGGMVRHDRSQLSDEHICILVTLRAWNRFLGYTS